MSPGPDEVPRIDVDAARELLSDGRALLVDVRDRSAWHAAHAAGALSVPLDELEQRLVDLPRGVRVITTCGGGSRGVRAARVLADAGRDASVLTGGMRAWQAAGLPLEHGE